LGRPSQNAAPIAAAISNADDASREIAPGSGVMLDRLRALVGQDEVLTAGDVTLDVGRHECIVRDEEVKLPLKEFELLEILLANAGRVVTRDTLIDRVWGLDYVGDTKTLDVHIKRLRSRIELDPSNPVLITTIRGVGYRLETPRR
jgi:two-component system response regulator RegX3